MPVVRSRSGLRVEAGRGYPRLKWSDINKSTIIANDLFCEKQDVELLSHASDPAARFNGCERRAEAKKYSSPEWNQRRHGVLIHSDGESDENSSDNSLICTDFRVSPDNGRVRMALTVPINRLASPQHCQHSVLQSTLRIKHTTLQSPKEPKGVEQHCSNSSSCAAGRCASKATTKRELEAKGIANSCTKDNAKNLASKSELSSLPFGFRDSHIFLCENKESFRPPSFWHDVKACKKGCLASQNRLRDGTFIISPSKSDTNLDQKRRGLKKLPRNSLYPPEANHFSLPMDRNLTKALPVRFDINTFPPLCAKSDKCSKNRHVANFTAQTTPLEGQRISSGDVTALPKKSSIPQTNSSSPSQAGTPNHSPTVHAAGNSSGRGKKLLKTSLKETTSRKTFQLKNKYSNSLGSNSPASLHGRVLQKTDTVSPAPPPHKKATENSPNNLTRFGFKSNPLITSGESTDSVNSILSDAQTTSDANSNIFDFGEKNRRSGCELDTKVKSYLDAQTSSSINVRSISPCTISQASSGVTSSALNGKIKAQTKQLPSPQIVTVKEMNKNSKKQPVPNSLQPKSRYSVPSAKKHSSPQRSPAVMPKDNRSKIPQNATKSSLPKVQKASKDTESSTRSLSTIDSGLGSSLESDKLRSPKLKERNRILDTGQDSDNTKEEKLRLDLSDEWLKEKHSRLETKGKFNINSKLFEDSLCQQNIPKNSSKSTKETFKDKRDSNITYGMARQKFAPYSRYRFSYQNTNNRISSQSDKSIKPESSTQTKSNISGGMVRSRIAQLEKTPSVTTTTKSSSLIAAPKKPATRPTSIEKTPILVSLKTENTIELSRSMCRRLEYSEGKRSLLDTTKDGKNERFLIEVPTTAQDLLMVDSYEVKREDIVEKKEEELVNSNMSVSIPDEKSLKVENETSEGKRIKDISECENTIKRFSDEVVTDNKNVGESDAFLHLPLQDSSSKVFSPDGSETSFEVLESGSVDFSPRDDSDMANRNDMYLTQLVAGLANSSSDCATTAKHSQGSPERVVPLKKCRQDSCNKEDPCDGPCEKPSGVDIDMQNNIVSAAKSVMESSTDSNRSDSNRMSDSCGDRWTVSGKCTPSLGSTRGDADQDFLIDDEISDQPGLTFGDDLDASLFGDEDLFSDISSPSATHLLSKSERSRHGSMGTASSLGPDDLMLDYDADESKPYGYEEEVLSPVACDILSEWSAILSGAHPPPSPPSPQSPDPCVSQQNGVVSTGCSSSLGAGLCSSPAQIASVTTHQPLTAESPPLSRTGSFNSRSRTCSVGPDFASSDCKRGLNLKPPRQGLSSEHDGGLNIDRTTLHYICQDVTTMKTLLHRLRRVLQVTDTINPFDANLKASLYLNLGIAESSDKEEPNSVHEVVQQNVDLKRQVVLLQQRLEEKDRTIRSLQQQLTQSLHKSTSSLQTLTNSSCLGSPDDEVSSSSRSLSNAATQTERSNHRSSPFSLTSMSRTASVEDGLGPTVSFENASARKSTMENIMGISNELEIEEEEVASPKKKYPSEFVTATPSPKLSLVPLTPTVTGSQAS